jgi:hypothetical protein
MIAQILFQLTSVVASIGRVKTSSHVVSRRFNALALGAVAADFAVKYANTGRADFLVRLIVFTVLTTRPELRRNRGEHVPAARRLRGCVPPLRRSIDCRPVLVGHPDHGDYSATAGRGRSWLPR